MKPLPRLFPAPESSSAPLRRAPRRRLFAVFVPFFHRPRVRGEVLTALLLGLPAVFALPAPPAFAQVVFDSLPTATISANKSTVQSATDPTDTPGDCVRANTSPGGAYEKAPGPNSFYCKRYQDNSPDVTYTVSIPNSSPWPSGLQFIFVRVQTGSNGGANPYLKSVSGYQSHKYNTRAEIISAGLRIGNKEGEYLIRLAHGQSFSFTMGLRGQNVTGATWANVLPYRRVQIPGRPGEMIFRNVVGNSAYQVPDPATVSITSFLSQVENVVVRADDATSVTAMWDPVPNATSYDVEFKSNRELDSDDNLVSENYVYKLVKNVTGTSVSFRHNAGGAITLTVKVKPKLNSNVYHDLAGTATIKVGSGSTQNSFVQDSVSFVQATADTAACYADVKPAVQGYIGEQPDGTPHVTRWKRVLATFGDDNGYMKMTATEAQTYADRGWARWDPVVEALTCLEAAGRVDADPGPGEPEAEPGITVTGGGGIIEGGNAVFTVHSNPAPPSELTVTINIDDDPASDFLATGDEGSQTVVIPAGQTSATLTLATENDSTDEPDGSVSATVASGTGYTVGSPSTATVAVSDDDDPPITTPVVSITGGNGITEGGAASFTLTATPAPQSDITVQVAVADSGSFATTGQTGTRSVTIGATGTAALTVATADDNTDEPDGSIAATIQAGNGYAVATSPDNGASVTVADNDAAPGLPSFSVDDAEANESDFRLPYTIRLSRASDRRVSVWVHTRESNPVSARDGVDYVGMGWGTRVVFPPGETERHLWIQLINDSHDEGSETFQVELLAPQGGATIADGVGVMTIVNSDPLPAAWHLRFGRTVSQQVVDALQDRLSSPAPLETGLQLALAGEDFTSDTPLAENQGLLSKALGFESVSHQLLVEGSSFSFAPQGEAGPQFALWGQGALSSFSGQEDEVSLDGDVTTLLLGGDWSTGRWQAGAALSHSWGNGSYDGEDDADGEISTSLTGLFPYGRYALSPRLGLWATAGYGWGDLSLKPDDGEEEYKPDTTMTMVALGMDGLLLDGGSEGVSLNTTADFLFLNATSEEVEDPRLESSEGNLSRFRLGLEATRPFPFANGSSLLPSMEVGIRQDGGDAETGFGMDLGAGIAWKDPQRGISGELKGRTLLSHAEEEFQDQGLALSFSWDPSPSNRGPSLSMGHAMGLSTEEGIGALLNPTVLDGLDGLDASPSSGQRFEAELAYGFPVHNDQLTMTPAVAMALSPTSRTYGLLWSVAPHAEQLQGEPWEVSLQAQRQESNSATATVDHSLKLNFSTLF